MLKRKQRNDGLENLDPQGYAYSAHGLNQKLHDAYAKCERVESNGDYLGMCAAKLEIEKIENKVKRYKMAPTPPVKETFSEKGKGKKQTNHFFSIFAYQIEKQLSLKNPAP